MTRRYFSPSFRQMGVVLPLMAVCLLSTPGTLRAQASMPAPGPCDTGTSNNGACRLHQAVTTSISPTRSLTVTPGATFSLLPITGELSATDYDAGFFDTAGSLTVSASATSAWRVTIQAASTALTGACAGKSAATILWGLSAGSRTNALTTTPVTIMSGATFASDQRLSIFFRVSLDWLTDAPTTEANCTLPVTFTISAP